MWCNQIFSLMQGETVQNIIVCDNYEVANQIARLQYGDTATAVDTTQYPLYTGCKYVDGTFYREDGVTVIPRTNTADEDAREAQGKAAALANQYAELAVDTDYRLSMLELGLV